MKSLSDRDAENDAEDDKEFGGGGDDFGGVGDFEEPAG